MTLKDMGVWVKRYFWHHLKNKVRGAVKEHLGVEGKR
jgi:hypothetical protein